MSDSPATPAAEGTFNVDLRGVHYDFLKDRVPSWFTQATAQRQQELANHELELPSWYLNATAQDKNALADSHSRYRETLNQVENSLGSIKDVLAFAEQPLKDAIKKHFNLDLEVKNVYFARKYGFKSRDDLFGAFVFEQQSSPYYEYRTVSLLEAALANFTPDEAQAAACSDCQIITTWDASNSAIVPDFNVINAHAVAIAPHEFAQMCRTLDLGNLYQQHIKSIVQPADAGKRAELETQLQEHQRQLLALSAEVARHQPHWGISTAAHRMIQQIITDPGSATLDGIPVTFAALKLFGSVLVGPLLIGPARIGSGVIERLVVYIPNDPQQPLREYPSSGDFMADLRTRLHSASYRRFFSRFVPQREQGVFFQQFNRLYKPANGNGAAGDYPMQSSPARLPVDELAISADLWKPLREAHLRKILSDARAVAVPTGDEDRKARMDRLSSYLDAVVSVFNLAAFVVPGLGPIMLAVGAAQMGSEVFEGFEAYEQGDIKAMWAHFASVALNVAFIGTGAKVLPEVKLVSMVDNLKPVTLPTGKQMLWNPDLTPYKVPVELAPDATPDALGLFQHNGQTILPHEGDHYSVRQEPVTGRFRIQHPGRPGAYEPLLEHNHAGAWSHEVEAPLTWDKATLVRRLGLEQRGLDPATLEQARSASGVDEDVLRQTFVDRQPVPLLLEDTLQHFKAHQALTRFIEQMNSPDPAVYAQADPALQLQIMRRRGMLPADTPLRILDSHGKTLWEDDAPVTASRRVVVVNDNQMAGGELLDQVLYSLQGIEPTLADIPGTAADTLAIRAAKLRSYIADIVTTYKGALVEEHYNALNSSDDRDVRLVLGTYPKLPASMATELLKNLTGEELQAFQNTGILPDKYQQQALWFEQETRVSRAYEGLHLDTLADIDSLRLALRTLETLPGWPRGTRVEMRQHSAQGTVLDAIGSVDSTTRRTLVLMDNGLFEAPMPRDFYAASWELLSAPERQALGFIDAAQLKSAIQQSPLPRAPLRTVLLEHPVRKPNIDPSLRLLGGGRGLRRLVTRVFGPSQASIDVRIKKLYPHLNAEELVALKLSLGEDIGAGLTLKEAESQTLMTELDTWVTANSSAASEPRPGSREPARKIASEIELFWRRLIRHDQMQLNLENKFELPVLSADFSHVERLKIYGAKSSANIDAFLKRFPRLKALKINRCRLEVIPSALSEMTELVSLDLSGNRISLPPQSATILKPLARLESLDLSNNLLGTAPDLSANPLLTRLNLRNTQLGQWPTGLGPRAGVQMKSVDLSYNLLHEVPDVLFTPTAEHVDTTARFNQVTRLEVNRFPDDYWKKFDDYWKNLIQTRPDLVEETRQIMFDSRNPSLEKVLRMYPNKSTQMARELIWGLGDGAHAKVSRLDVEFTTLQRQLDAWTFSGGGEHQRYVRTGQRQANAMGRDDRLRATQRILECWRRETPPKLASDGQSIGLELDLSDLTLPSLPDLDVDFSHVGSLKLNNMGLRTSPEGFLARFTHVRWLDLSNNQLRTLPPALGDMHGLTRLFLNHNLIELTEETARILSQRVTLRALWLHHNSLRITPDFSQITDLRSLAMRNAGISTWPEGLLEQPHLDQIELSDNQIETLPAAIIAPTSERLAQTVRVSAVTSVAGNPLTPDTVRQVREYHQQLEQAGLASAQNPNLLVTTALNTRAAVVPGAVAQQRFLRWAQGLSDDQLSTRKAQWLALHDEDGADPFFVIIDDLRATGSAHADLQQRIWEVIDSISENTEDSERLRRELFELAGAPACCDRAAFIFSNLEVRTLIYKARVQALDKTQGEQLANLSKGLFRLQEVDKIAAADIQRSEAIVNDPAVSMAEKTHHRQRLTEEVEIRLAYRHGLKDRLQLPGQPKEVSYTHLGDVTPAMLDAAYEQVIALDNSPAEFQALLSQEFWQDYITEKYRAQFNEQAKPFQKDLATLQERLAAEQVSEAFYNESAGDLQAQLAITESALIEALTREEIVEILVPRERLEVLVPPGEHATPGLQLAQAQVISFNGKQYLVASMPDAGDGEHYTLWVQAQDNPFSLISSAIIAKPDAAGVWKRRGTAGGMLPGASGNERTPTSTPVTVMPYTADELSYMRRDVHFTTVKNIPGSYNRANNGKYPLRDLQGRPIRIRKLQRSVEREDSGTRYTSAQIKPYIQFEGYEHVAALYEQKLQLRTFTEQDMKVPQEKSLIGQSMVVAAKAIAKGETVGVYGGVVLPAEIFGTSQQTYIMHVGSRATLAGGVLGTEAVYLSGDNILSRINTNLEYDATGKPIRQATGGYNVEAVPFDVEADMWLGVGPSAATKRKNFILTSVFATEDIPAGSELRMNYEYTESMIKTQFS
ncbi:hypothetical protein C4K03_2673 [Pseudomonas synxantha]|uniref:RING-type E3 ubiquitin transferase n=1 Tax=Pseudomonas synxantha TaxID=47883 RepID=A0A3G7U845_9PSED|nr:NEL-type E3 ubiquitin ligase domain-containing protein [Pseudomonas synxantha]AZE54828.1 hypothetical protein C4K03_2673 [Pseudomonas synxantha]